MIDLVTSYVFNGSITGDNYVRWLPFYDYGYYVIALFTVSMICARLGYKFFSNVFIFLSIASLISLPILWFLYNVFYPEPFTVFLMWFVIQFICYVSIAFIASSFIRFSKFETKEEYMEHIKKEHPDIWEKYHKDNEDNEH